MNANGGKAEIQRARGREDEGADELYKDIIILVLVLQCNERDKAIVMALCWRPALSDDEDKDNDDFFCCCGIRRSSAL